MLPAKLITAPSFPPPHTQSRCEHQWWSGDHSLADAGKGQGGKCKSWLLLIMFVMTVSSIMGLLKCSATTAQGYIFQRIQFSEVSQKLGHHCSHSHEKRVSSDCLALTVHVSATSPSKTWLQQVKSITFMQLKISLTFRRKQAKEKQNTSIEQTGKNTAFLPFPRSWYLSLGTWSKHFKNSGFQTS